MLYQLSYVGAGANASARCGPAGPPARHSLSPSNSRAIQPGAEGVASYRPMRSSRSAAPSLDSCHVFPAIVTIGVYGFDLPDFLDALGESDVRLLVDARQRRGVRGPRYAWANSQRLQAALADAGIAYSHHRDLAPTTELRRLQYAADAVLGVGTRSRERLDPAYRDRYIDEILDRADLDALVAEMPTDGPTALLCVEADPEACHRGLIAERLAQRYGLAVTHVRPAEAQVKV